MPRPSRHRSYEQRSSGPPEHAPSALTEEGRCDANLSENTPSGGKNYALHPVSAMFAQIIVSSWEIEDEEEEDECDAIGDHTDDEADAIGEETKDQSDAKGVTHNQKEIGYRLQWMCDDFLKSKLQATNADKEVVDPSQYISDVANRILSSTTFEQFIEALPIEAAKTIGWDQVALYSSIIHTSIMMVGVGTEIKHSVSSYASQYFQSRFSDWINSQPRGWASIFDDPRSVPTDLSNCD